MRSLLTEVEDLLRSDHAHLRASDRCYFLREYLSGGGYSASKTNDLISNLKKPVDRRGKPEWRHKLRAIETAAAEMAEALVGHRLAGTVLVPIPPSKSPDDPEYDDRMQQLAERVAKACALEARALLYTKVSRASFHLSGDPRNLAALIANLGVDQAHATPAPRRIALVDDVLTTGADFVAAKTVMQRFFGDIEVIGLFVARRIFRLDASDDPFVRD